MSLTKRLAGLRHDERGVALVEFACVLPVLLLMYLAGYQLTDALSCNRKVTIASRAMADLTTQNSTVTTDQMNTILSAAAKIMAPYDASNAAVRVTELYTDQKGKTTVYWSTPNGKSTALKKGDEYILPNSLNTASRYDTYLIVSEVTYSYKPAVNFGIVGPLALYDKIYMNPRISKSVEQK
jgi:Flp pilus assembly protein TadG